jgi:[NiFe] hydrogenase assembly HybE family chaperone
MTERPGAPQELAVAFRRISTTRMLDMPLRNPALDIDVVGFRSWEDRQVGVLVTPWAISLVILPAPALALDQRQRWTFPSGEYEFMGGAEPECGPFQFCSLFSPPEGIADQDEARAIAEAVMEQLFAVPAATAARSIPRRDLFGLRRADGAGSRA